MTVPFIYDMYNFRSLSNEFPTNFRSWHFPVSLPNLGYFVEKTKPKIFGLKNAI